MLTTDLHPTPVNDAACAHLALFVGPQMQPEAQVCATLARAGWRCLWLGSVDAAMRAAAHACFDAVVLPAEGVAGASAHHIEALGRALDCPVLVVAEHGDEVDEIIALEFGADAYLAGPLAPRRLRAHLQVLLRRRTEPGGHRMAGNPGPRPLALGAWLLDMANLRLESDLRQVTLTELQCALLQRLGERAGRVVARHELLEGLSQRGPLHLRSVDVYVARLRRRLREQRVPELSIEGVRGRGYTLSVQTLPPLGNRPRPWAPGRDAAGRLPAQVR